jgi:hypothetical protein
MTMMTRLREGSRRFIALLVTAGALAMPISAWQPPAGQQEYLPVDQLPPSEQLPGGVFVVVAYGFIWIAMMLYLWFVWRRLSKVENEMRALRRRAGSGVP